MKKMTKAILCLISVWGTCWAQQNEFEKKYADLEAEFAEKPAVSIEKEAPVKTSKPEEPKSVKVEEKIEQPAASVPAEESVQVAEKTEPAKEAQQTVAEEPQTVAEAQQTVAEEPKNENVAVADSVPAEDVNTTDSFDEKEEITADDAEAMAKATPAQPDGAIEETLDFSTWINPACKPVHTTSPYKIRKGRLHRGVDVKVAIGDSIVAAAPGKVIISKYNKGGYGHYIVLKHDNGTQTVYGHLSKRLKNVGDYANQGELIGLGGNTGRSTGSHLHFEIRYGEVNIDPATVINFDEGKLMDNVDKYSVSVAAASHKEIQKELSKHRTHKIKAGDTLGKLAIKYGTTVDKICKLNKITRTTVLRIGKILQIS